MDEYTVVSDEELEVEAQIAAGLVELVAEAHACPGCSERRIDWLAWLDDERVKCEACGEVYFP